MSSPAARNPLTELALSELSGSAKDRCASATSTYLNQLQNIGVIRGSKYPYQTDSFLIAPIFNSIERNRYPLISPYKLATPTWGEDKSPTSTIFATTAQVGNHEDASIQIQANSTNIRSVALITKKNKSEISFDNDDVLEYNGYYIIFHVAPGSTVAGVTMHYGRTPGFCQVEPYLSENVKNRPTFSQYSSAPIKFSSVFTPGNRATAIPANSPAGLYLYNVRKIPGSVPQGSTVGSSANNAQVFGYIVQEELLYMSSYDSEPTVLFSFTDNLDTGYGYEDEFNLANLNNLKSTAEKLRYLAKIKPAPETALDQLNLMRSTLQITSTSSKYKVPNNFIGKTSTKPNSITDESIENFYNGFSRRALNKSILNYYQDFLSGPIKGLSRFITGYVNKKRPTDLKSFEMSNTAVVEEANARLTLDSFCLTEDTRADYAISSYRHLLNRQKEKPENFPLENMTHRLGESNFVMPWSPSGPTVQGGVNHFIIGKILKNEQLMRGTYKFFGAGTGLNTREKAVDFMKSTFSFIQSIPRL